MGLKVSARRSGWLARPVAYDNRAWCTGDDDERPDDLGGGRPASRRPPGSGGECCEHVAFENVGRWPRRIVN